MTKAKKSIAGFKLREGNAIGAKVTLRGARMWEFLDRLIALAIPRVRDFRGLDPRSFDGRGNYTFGVTEQLIFPEIDYDQVDAPRGMDITIVTTAESDEQGRALLVASGSRSSVKEPADGQEGAEEQAAAHTEVQGPRPTRRCKRCGRPHSVYRKFGLCRVCLREMVHGARSPASRRPAGEGARR